MDPHELKAWRERNSLTQQGAADALGIGRRTLLAYEQGQSDIPRVLEFACNWLDQNPAAIEQRNQLRIALPDGGEAGWRDVAIANHSLIKHTLSHFQKTGALTDRGLLDICNAAIEEHHLSPAGDRPWTKAVVGLIRETFYDLMPHKRGG